MPPLKNESLKDAFFLPPYSSESHIDMVKGRNRASSGSDSENANIFMNGQSMSKHVRESLERLGDPLPKLVAFDLDYTCWPLWVDTHVDPPLKRRGESLNKVYDRSGTPLSLYPHIPPILFFLHSKRITVAAASRTCAPTVARQALNNLLIVDDGISLQESENTDTASSIRQSNNGKGRQTYTPIPAMKLFDQLEIYPGSKITHFRKLHEKTGIAYEDMIFFDDEYRNAEVSSKLGVHFELVGHQGTDLATFENAIRQWRAKKKARQGDSDAGKELLE
ncbi:hypothetical protein L7F22_019680 [Adiantum nelumboides]|nr:hypothetical protein [Adiantum nelumboides]